MFQGPTEIAIPDNERKYLPATPREAKRRVRNAERLPKFLPIDQIKKSIVFLILGESTRQVLGIEDLFVINSLL
jgi:hypothetical protein